MHNTRLRFFIMALCVLIIMFLLPQISMAIPPPVYPSIAIVVVNAPRDLSIQFKINDKWINADIDRRAWETYFFCVGDTRIYDAPNMKLSSIRVDYADKCFDIALPIDSWDGEFLYTLNPHTGSLIEGEYSGRTMILILLRLVGLLTLNAAIFYFLGFRTRKSWQYFTWTHLFTQFMIATLFTFTDDAEYAAVYFGFYLLFGLITLLMIFAQDFILYQKTTERSMKYRVLYILFNKIMSIGLLILIAQYLPIA